MIQLNKYVKWINAMASVPAMIVCEERSTSNSWTEKLHRCNRNGMIDADDDDDDDNPVMLISSDDGCRYETRVGSFLSLLKSYAQIAPSARAINMVLGSNGRQHTDRIGVSRSLDEKIGVD